MNIKKGLAFIVANSAYQHLNPIQSCLKDGIDMSSVLKELEFDVIESFNETRENFYDSASKFLECADSYSTVLFYFSGHGVQIDGKNYLAPIDCNFVNNKTIFTNKYLIDLEIISKYMQQHSDKTNIIILDACRENLTFTKGFGTTGLAPMNAGSGTFIAFATAPGDYARGSISKDENSVYTKYLINHISRLNTKIEDMFKLVRIDVEKATNKEQQPWDNTSLKSDFYFNTTNESTMNETIYQLIRNNSCAETILYIHNISALKISDIIRMYQRQKSEKPGGIQISCTENFESIVLRTVLDFGFYMENYRWFYKQTPVIMGEFLHNPFKFEKL